MYGNSRNNKNISLEITNEIEQYICLDIIPIHIWVVDQFFRIGINMTYANSNDVKYFPVLCVFRTSNRASPCRLYFFDRFCYFQIF